RARRRPARLPGARRSESSVKPINSSVDLSSSTSGHLQSVTRIFPERIVGECIKVSGRRSDQTKRVVTTETRRDFGIRIADCGFKETARNLAVPQIRIPKSEFRNIRTRISRRTAKSAYP